MDDTEPKDIDDTLPKTTTHSYEIETVHGVKQTVTWQEIEYEQKKAYRDSFVA